MAVEAALLAMRRDGVLSTDKGGRPPDPAWVAAALDAFQLLPTGVRLGTEVQALRQELGGGASLRGWLEQRGVDGRQTRKLGTWLERLSLVRPAPRQVATVLIEWASRVPRRRCGRGWRACWRPPAPRGGMRRGHHGQRRASELSGAASCLESHGTV